MKKYILFLLPVAAFFLITSCHKSKGPDSPIQGTWYIKSMRCYQDPGQNWIPYIFPNSYYRFNADYSGEQFNAGLSLSSHFTYAMLNNDSVFSITSTGNLGVVQTDTMVIMKLTANEFIYHSTRTTVPANALCLNILDSLYR